MATQSNVDATLAAAATLQPTKALAFNVVAPNQASSVHVIDAVAGVVGLPLVYMVHYLGGLPGHRTYTRAAKTHHQARGDLTICDQKAALELLALQVTRFACMSLPG